MTTILDQAVQTQAGAFSQQLGTAVARQQIDTERSVAAPVAPSVTPPESPGQGRAVDLEV